MFYLVWREPATMQLMLTNNTRDPPTPHMKFKSLKLLWTLEFRIGVICSGQIACPDQRKRLPSHKPSLGEGFSKSMTA
jgi:hypothetical protein